MEGREREGHKETQIRLLKKQKVPRAAPPPPPVLSVHKINTNTSGSPVCGGRNIYIMITSIMHGHSGTSDFIHISMTWQYKQAKVMTTLGNDIKK
jgi:hypothetical protein